MSGNNPLPTQNDFSGDGSTKPRTRIARYDEYFDTVNFSTVLTKTKTRKAPDPDNKKISRKPILVIRRQMNEQLQLKATCIDIISPGLRDILAEVNRDVTGFELSGQQGTINPKALFHSRPRLERCLNEELAKEPRNDLIIEDITTIIDYAKEYWATADIELERYLSRQEITYNHLWAIFPPTSFIYRRFQGTDQDQILRVLRTKDLNEKKQSNQPFAFDFFDMRDNNNVEENQKFILLCQVIHNDGYMFGTANVTISIDLFEGTKKLEELGIYPLNLCPDHVQVRDNAIARGKTFAALNGPTFKEVSGLAATKDPDRSEVIGRPGEVIGRQIIDGRIMIDPRAFNNTFYLTMESDESSSISPRVEKAISRDKLTDDQYMICMPYVLGFSFGDKMWGAFALDRARDVDWTVEAFDNLVMGEEQKTLIRGLVHKHSAGRSQFDDIVRGKGRGLVGLLSGAPGTGKTLTAEAVAEAARKPLYIVSAGELGTESSRLDKNLSKIFGLAQSWDAVLLLDEAEVFLKERSPETLDRNTLVSIFLRQLEYFQGILILTTNMPSTCDKAMESRIHFCVHYPPLDVSAKHTIWKMFIDRSGIYVPDDELDRLARLSLNGRQIKNAVSSANSIALDQNVSPSIKHINVVINVLSQWEAARNAET